MISSVIDICNMALDYCNVRNITSLEEDTKEAKKCLMWYDNVRQDLLMNMNASFSIKRAVLAEYLKVEIVYGYDKAFALPPDCLQVLNMDSPVEDRYYQIEENHIYCDSRYINEVPKIRYIADVKDVTKFDAKFADCLALFLAEKICYPLTEDEQKAAFIRSLAQVKYVEASSKYGRDNRMIVINKPRYRQAKEFPEIFNVNYPAK